MPFDAAFFHSPPRGLCAAPHYRSLRFAQQVELDPAHDGALHLIHGSGRGLRLRVPPGWWSLSIPLLGSLTLESVDGSWDLPLRRMQVWRDGALRVGSRTSALWLTLAGSPAAWVRHLPSRDASPHDLFPRESACPRELLRLLVHLARGARGARVNGDPAALLDAACSLLIEEQRDLSDRLARCSGRTSQRRRQTLLRLLRVRHLIERCVGDRTDTATLAFSASYSSWHLIRMFREVFDETPSEYAARLRLDRALALVRDTRMPVCEITELLGFKSQSSFCRAFKNAYGITTGEVRDLDGRARNDARRSPAETLEAHACAA